MSKGISMNQQNCATCDKNERESCIYIKKLIDEDYTVAIRRRHIQVMKKVTAAVGCMSYSNKDQETDNPEMQCLKFYQDSPVIPKNCYNCINRNGYPYYLFGDDGCENFIKKNNVSDKNDD